MSLNKWRPVRATVSMLNPLRYREFVHLRELGNGFVLSGKRDLDLGPLYRRDGGVGEMVKLSSPSDY